MQISTIGIDLAKTVFQIHAVDADIIRKRLRRAEVLSFVSGLEPCLIGMDGQQAVLMLHRTRALLIRQQTMLANAFRAHLAEFGIVAAQGIRHVRILIERVFGEGAHAIDLPILARTALRPLVAQLMELRLQIKTIEKELLAWHRTSQESRRLEAIPGVSFITATAIAATVTDPSHFRSGREFPAWLGLTPRQNSSGGKDRLGRVSKMCNGYLRRRRSHGDDPLCRKSWGQLCTGLLQQKSLLESVLFFRHRI
jgi:transposase